MMAKHTGRGGKKVSRSTQNILLHTVLKHDTSCVESWLLLMVVLYGDCATTHKVVWNLALFRELIKAGMAYLALPHKASHLCRSSPHSSLSPITAYSLYKFFTITLHPFFLQFNPNDKPSAYRRSQRLWFVVRPCLDIVLYDCTVFS